VPGSPLHVPAPGRVGFPLGGGRAAVVQPPPPTPGELLAMARYLGMGG
jgi:hypothetical protein